MKASEALRALVEDYESRIAHVEENAEHHEERENFAWATRFQELAKGMRMFLRVARRHLAAAEAEEKRDG